MIKSRAVLAASLLVMASAASAEITITPTLTSDYDLRGITQSDREWAAQLGVTYTSEVGAYLGLWGSNVDLSEDDDADVEIDVYAGYAGGDAQEGWGYDVGAIYYTYPSAGSLNYPEIYTGVSRGPFSAKLWYSWDYASSGDTSYYADVNLNMPSGEGMAVLFHMGYSGGEYWNTGVGKYMDWSLGFAADIKGWTATIKYVDGADLKVSHPRNLGRVVFSMSKTFTSGE